MSTTIRRLLPALVALGAALAAGTAESDVLNLWIIHVGSAGYAPGEVLGARLPAS
jgi:hypothetical protein